MAVHSFPIRTHSRDELVDITSEVSRIVSKSGMEQGIITIFIPHTTAAVTINENADPTVKRDILMELDKRFPWEDGYHHSEGNSAAHVKTSLVGSSEPILVEGGRMVLGTWQGIYFCEFDGPRSRKVHVHIP